MTRGSKEVDCFRGEPLADTVSDFDAANGRICIQSLSQPC
jgi:hypothetical protein